jgi:hypothetical protein
MASGENAFCILRGTVNAQAYIQVLRSQHLPLFDTLSVQKACAFVFQQDKARPHIAQPVRMFLQEESIPTTPWPPYSPDLNPIENVWGLLKRYIRLKQPSTLKQLEKALLSGWKKIVTPTLCSNLVFSLPQRVKRVIGRAGLR